MTYHNAYAAKVNSGIVIDVVVIPHVGDTDEAATAYCNSIGLPGSWLDCSFLGSRRGVFPGLGYTFDADANRFYAPEVKG
jgi:hypothetical protein